MSGATERPDHTPMRDDSDSGRQRDVSTQITRRRALAGVGGLLASAEQDTTGPADTGDYELTGTLTEIRAFEADAFSPPKDGTREVDVAVEVRLEVRDARGQTLANASASDSLTLAIDDSGVRVKADIGGSASVSVPSDRSGD